MATSFRRPHQFLRNRSGIWVQGEWVPAADPAPVDVMATVQPASSSDYDRVEALQGGERPDALLRVYTDERMRIRGAGPADLGDILLYDGRRWLLIGEALRGVLRTRVSHNRYLATPELPAASEVA